MTRYIVFSCPRCGLVRYARKKQKTARCPGCDYKIRIDPSKTRILAEVEEVRDAINIVKAFKAYKARLEN